MHTYAPWIVEPNPRDGGISFDVLGRETPDGSIVHVATVESRPDAALVAAAPKMLAVIAAVVGDLEDLEEAHGYHLQEDFPRLSERSKELRELLREIQVPPWTRCPCCENWLCHIHKMHAHECPCPPVDEWEERGESPYLPGGKP